VDEPALAGPLPAWLADEVALLLTAEGIAADRIAGTGGTFIVVAQRDRVRAARIVAEEYPDGLATAAAARTAVAPGAAPRSLNVLPSAGAGQPANAEQPTGAAQDRWFGRGSWILFALSAACAAVFVAEEWAGGSETRTVLLRFGASRPAHVRAGEWWRLVTAIFVHIGPRHLLANVAALLVLGPALAAALGAGRFAFIYVLAGAAGNALSYLTAPSDMVSAGASGAILGVLGALGGQRIRFAASARYRGWQVVAALLAYLAIAVGAEPGVDTMAHLGGLGAGFVLGLCVPPPLRVVTARDRLVSVACGATALALVTAAFAALVRATRNA
jgi:membrane associated rhomboid family serine protease